MNPNKDYHGSKKFRPAWSTPADVRHYLEREVAVGDVLNVCCGPAGWGDCRVDVDPAHGPDVVADVHSLPFEAGAFETVFVDPPFSLYAYPRGYWPAEPWRVASDVLILESPAKRVTIPRTVKEWVLAEPAPGGSLMAVKHFQVFRPAGRRLSEF